MDQKRLKYIQYIILILFFINLSFGQHSHDHEHEKSTHTCTLDSLNSDHECIHDSKERHEHTAENTQVNNDNKQNSQNIHNHQEHVEQLNEESNHEAHSEASKHAADDLHKRIKVEKITPQSYTNTIHTAGEIELAPGNENVIIAKSSGKIKFHRQSMTPGISLNVNELLFTISGSGVINDNLTLEYTRAKNDFANSKENYLRGQKLAQDKIISVQELQKRRAKYLSDSTRYFIIKENFKENDLGIASPIAGNLFKLFVKNGEFVREGQKLAIIHKKQNLLLKVDLPKQYYAKINNISKIEFKQEYSDEIHQLKICDCQKVGLENRLEAGNPYLSLSYKLPHDHELLPGSFTEIWLGISQDENSIVLPKSAIIEQQGLYYVFVKKGQEDFHKTKIEIDSFNANQAKIIAGVHPGDLVVVDGALELKISQSKSGASSHNHNH